MSLKKLLRKLRYRSKIRDHEIFFENHVGKKLDLKNPRDFNEKIQWLILNYYGKREGKLADKDYVKKYVKKLNIPGLKIPKTLGVYNCAEEIDLKMLPEKFVLKCNHFSGNVFICCDKRVFDFETAKKRLDESLRKNFADINLEYHYSYIRPVIMAEEYLNDGKNTNPKDYKFYCFNGRVESILVCSNREKKLKLNDYDLDWNELDYTKLSRRSKERIKKPKNLKKMIKIAEKLTKNIKFVRVDLYEIGDDIYFGEYTFTPGAGIIDYYKQDALDYLGGLIDIKEY